MESIDFERMRRLRDGDRSALAELYDRYTALLYPILVRITGDPVAADEALVDAWTRVWRHARSYDPNRAPVAAWLLTVARSCAMERMPAGATVGRRGAAEPELAAALADDPFADSAHRQLSERVRRAIGALEPKHRRVLEGAYFDGLSAAEIAGRMNVPPAMVPTWTRQALTRLRDLLPNEAWT